MHLLPGSDDQLALLKTVDADRLVREYFVITLGKNSGYYISPNAAYDRVTGYAPGERCCSRDLTLDLYRALQSKDIKLMMYPPCQVPNRDARAENIWITARQERADVRKVLHPLYASQVSSQSSKT